jgi:hypothetical protein
MDLNPESGSRSLGRGQPIWRLRRLEGWVFLNTAARLLGSTLVEHASAGKRLIESARRLAQRVGSTWAFEACGDAQAQGPRSPTDQHPMMGISSLRIPEDDLKSLWYYYRAGDYLLVL